jgi:isochorismate synthase
MTLENFFKRIDQQYRSHLPFVIYRKPNKQLVNGILQANDKLYSVENFKERGFIFSPFDDSEDAVLIPLDVSEVISESYIIPTEAEVHSISSSDSSESRQQHLNLIKKGIHAIEDHKFQKVVLSRRESVEVSEENPIAILKKLLNTYASAFVYCWYHPKIGLWLGATPETLLKIEDNRFSMMALAATQDYKGTLDVVWHDKEKKEQQFVTDFIVEHISPSVDRLKVSDLETVKAGNLLHLRTMITATLKPEATNLKDIVSTLHPTPAVCGFPKIEAKQFILDHESYNREFYTGFLGELNFESKIAPRASKRNIENRAYAVIRKSTQLYVNLRCMQIKDNKAIVYVGGGILKNSNPESEWEETVLKSKVIKNIL